MCFLAELPQIAQLQQMNVDQPLSVPVYHHLQGLVKLDFTN
jgi:hypothetical protein